MNQLERELNQSPRVLEDQSHYPKLQLLSIHLIQRGVIIASFCSVIISTMVYFSSWDFYENNPVYSLGLLITTIVLILAMIGSGFGFFITLLGLLKSRIRFKTQLMIVGKNPHLYIIISLILANWALIMIPGFLFLPLTLIDSGFGIHIWGQRGWLFPYPIGVHSYELVGKFPSLISFVIYYLDSPDSNIFLGLFRLIGLILFLFTIGYLIYRIVLLIKNREELQVSHSQLLLFLELEFLVLLVGVLIFEALPLWEFFDSKANHVVMMFDNVNFFITPQVSLSLITFLLTGNISQPFCVIDNLHGYKKRLFYSISLVFITSLIFWLLYLFPLYL